MTNTYRALQYNAFPNQLPFLKCNNRRWYILSEFQKNRTQYNGLLLFRLKIYLSSAPDRNNAEWILFQTRCIQKIRDDKGSGCILQGPGFLLQTGSMFLNRCIHSVNST